MHNNMDASHKHKVKLKKTGTKEFVLYCVLDSKLKTWQNYCVRNLDSGYPWR